MQPFLITSCLLYLTIIVIIIYLLFDLLLDCSMPHMMVSN